MVDYLGASAAAGLRLVLDPAAGAGGPAWTAGTAIEIAVGPEGGFTPEESDAMRVTGYAGVALGPRILRAETAAVAAVAWLQTRFGDMISR